MTKPDNIRYQPLELNDFPAIITLATEVHGEGYVDMPTLAQWREQGLFNGINSGCVAYDEKRLVGYRITFAAGQWTIDRWSSPQLWQVPAERVCYFKCNTVHSDYRGYGIGAQLLKRSTQATKQQGALAGVAHLWQQSPNNSAVQYFTHCGGIPIKTHNSKWNQDCEQGYICTLCGNNCHCGAEEMILHFV